MWSITTGAAGALLSGGGTLLLSAYGARRLSVAHSKLELIQAELTKRGIALHEIQKRDILIPVGASIVGMGVGIGIDEAAAVATNAIPMEADLPPGPSVTHALSMNAGNAISGAAHGIAEQTREIGQAILNIDNGIPAAQDLARETIWAPAASTQDAIEFHAGMVIIQATENGSDSLTMNGNDHLSGKANDKPLVNHRNTGRQRRSLLTLTFSVVARLAIWATAFYILFRCPSSLKGCNETAPRVCKLYFLIKGTISSYILPYYLKYLPTRTAFSVDLSNISQLAFLATLIILGLLWLRRRPSITRTSHQHDCASEGPSLGTEEVTPIRGTYPPLVFSSEPLFWRAAGESNDGDTGEIEGRTSDTVTKQPPQSKDSASTVRLAPGSIVRGGTYPSIANIYGRILTFLSDIGLREENVAPGCHRIRWRNKCGKWLYDDYIEHEIGAIQALKDYLSCSVYASEATATNGLRQESAIAAPSTSSSSCIRGNFSGSADISDQNHRSGEVTQSSPSRQDPEKGNSSTNTLHLLCCMDQRKHAVFLHEELVTDVTDDRHLFQALRNSYYEHRGRLKRYWSLRTIQSIHFMKFAYGGRRLIDVRCHNEICIQGQPCACLPPTNLVKPLGSDYECSPIPSKLSPPIGPRLMMDLFNKPEDIEPNSELVLRQLPKWLGGKLPSQCVETKEAWGIYYKEDWDWTKVWWILGLGFFPPSLLFGILWGILKQDIQGAFGVASWWMTGATIVLGIVGTNA
ncbi:uncharacterized protein FTOL_13086 [Fusarium torulosum]|uniref:Uncharacterized protein n=1 Tax=Fusarium torulosum TaxID=33205 RepID=A0AAE8MMX1_9HYPO|nr:uncharacterized protein FTOL_13086 [Fusarium torulosum]